MRWLVAGVAVVAVGAVALVVLRDDAERCSFSSTILDGLVLPSAPDDPDVAFQQFLETAADDYDLPSDDMSDWIGTGHETAVNWEHGGVMVHMRRQVNGWAVGSIERNYNCD